TVVANIGRFGPYVKYGNKYVSLKDDDPYTVTLERALEVIRLKQQADANRTIIDFGVDGIQVLNGRYGPYVTDGKKNAKIPKNRAPKTLTFEECRLLIEQAPARGGRCGRGKRGGAAANATAAKEADGGAAGNGKGDGAAAGASTQQPGKAKRPRPSAPATAAQGAPAAAGRPVATVARKPAAAATGKPETTA